MAEQTWPVPLKILYHHRTASKDGQAVHIEELIAAFRRLGHEVVVVGPSLGGDEAFGGEHGLVAQLKRRLPRACYEVLELAYSLVAYVRLARAVRAHRPEVLYERYNLYLPAGTWLRRTHALPLFLEVNAPLFEERRDTQGIAIPALARWSQRATWRGADTVLAVTDVLARHVTDTGVPAERVVVVPNGINRERFLKPIDGGPVRARLGLADGLVLGFTGFIRDWHGLDTAVDMLADERDRDLRLLIVGDGPGRAAVEQRARARGVEDRVVVTGVVQRAEVASFVAAFDVALQPAVVAYASPLKIFEYLALGRPVVAPDADNIREILEHGKTAMLFAPGDPQAFRDQVLALCVDAELRQRIGAAGRRLIDTRGLTWDDNAARLLTLFERALTANAAIPAPTPQADS